MASVISAAAAYSQYDPATGTTGDPLTIGATVGVAIFGAFIWALLNALRVDQQGWINNFAAAWQIVTTIVIVICVLAMPAKDPDIPSNWIWTYPYNGTGIPSENFGYVMLLGLLYACFSFSGYEAGAHMAEETRNASTSSPWGVVATCCTVAALGYIYIIGLMYGTTSIMGMSFADWSARSPASSSSDFYYYWNDVGGYLTEAMATVSGSSIADLYVAACGATTGRALIALLIINVFFAGISSLTVTSRIAYAMARDGAFPYSWAIRPVSPFTKTPLATVALVFVVDALLLLLPLGATQAFAAVTSITVIGYQISCE